MAGERTFTEGEAYALVADAVERETAAAKTKVEEQDAQIVSLGNEKDALELRVTAAEEKAATAEKALDDYKAEVEAQKAMEAKRDERLAKVAEIAPTLVTDDDKGRERAGRIVAMADEAFEEYVEGLRQVAAVGPHPFKKASDGKCSVCDGAEGASAHTAAPAASQKASEGGALPRESAAFQGGKTGEGNKPTASVKGLFSAQRALSQPKSA